MIKSSFVRIPTILSFSVKSIAGFVLRRGIATDFGVFAEIVGRGSSL